MNQRQRSALRIAADLQENLQAVKRQRITPSLPAFTWQECERFARLIEIAENRGWYGAARLIRLRWHASLARLRDELAEAAIRSTEPTQEAETPDLRQIYDGLVSLEDEFVEVQYKLQEQTISVVTEPVVLDGIELGPFEIALRLGEFDKPQPYDVIALEQYSARACEDTPHPHVRGRCLCEGEGREAIAAAIEQGRVHDFFLVIRTILGTYNPDSAYVKLDDWDGINCSDCESMISDDDATSCERCESTVCLDCSVRCASCEYSHCCMCLQSCPGCDDSFCAGCLHSCVGCDETLCTDCLTDNKCEKCHETDDEDIEGTQSDLTGETCDSKDAEAPTTQTSTTPSFDATIQPNGLVQTPVLAR